MLCRYNDLKINEHLAVMVFRKFLKDNISLPMKCLKSGIVIDIFTTKAREIWRHCILVSRNKIQMFSRKKLVLGLSWNSNLWKMTWSLVFTSYTKFRLLHERSVADRVINRLLFLTSVTLLTGVSTYFFR